MEKISKAFIWDRVLVRAMTMLPGRGLREGDDRHVKGFILNKLYLGGYFARRGRHGKHTSVDNLPKGYPLKHRGKFPEITDELRREGFVIVLPSGGEKHVCAVLDSEKIEEGLRLCNAYRGAVGLPPLDERFREIF